MRCISAAGMGRRRGWFSAVKKALGSEHKDHGNPKSRKPKKKWFAKHQRPDPMFVSGEDDSVANASHSIKEPDMSTTWTAPWCILEEPYAAPVIEQMKSSGVRSEDKEHDHNVALAAEVAAEDAVVSTQTTAEVVRVPKLTRFAGKSREEVAAIKIQTAFRGRRAKRAMRALRGLVRLMSLVQGSSTKHQTASTLQCMQTLSRVQSQIRARRIRMSEENQALQRQLQQKHDKEIEKMKLTIDGWNGSTKSKEKLEESLHHRQEAAMRRERALAYAHSQQQKWRNASKTPNPTLMDEINPYWGWSWLERWMSARPWETSIESDNGGRTSALSVAEISKAYYAHRECYPDDSNKPLPIPQRTSHTSSRHSQSASASKAPSTPSKATKLKSSSTKDTKSKSLSGVLSDKQRRHSVANSSASRDRDKKSLPTAHSARRSTVPTVAYKAKSRLQKSSSSAEKSSQAASGPVMKRLSSSPSPTPSGARRHSGPPSVLASSIKDMGLTS